MTDVDVYQQRYLDHIERKRRSIGLGVGGGSFWEVLGARHSQRTFNDLPLNDGEWGRIYEAIIRAPSSCNRQAIVVKRVETHLGKERLDSLLVGGEGWLSGAAAVLLLFADMRAYKSIIEKDYMPWLDTGFVSENVYLAAEALGLGCCYVNPHIKGKDVALVDAEFNPLSLRFCGALALGHYDVRGPESPKREVCDIFYPEDGQ